MANRNLYTHTHKYTKSHIKPTSLENSKREIIQSVFLQKAALSSFVYTADWRFSLHQWRTEGWGGLGCSNPAPKFQRPSKIVPNSTRLWKLLKIAEFRTPTTQDVWKKGSKILKLPRFATVLH